ncbi:glycoside hydrolase family 73 protein [Clostridium hydrogeniformans]|uniref:glycoside hydrolase family 73 protein n=1 Tax=Clostridium hydrogeniformans TaxID=349933 RepID=UPI00068A6369|nr:glycoside hydrolase family 73 protein [Clostridium hydrogeniformans]
MKTRTYKNNSFRKAIIKLLIGTLPITLIMTMLIVFMASISMYFSSGSLSDKLTDTENNELIEKAKSNIEDLSNNMKDYYGTDRRFKLEYQFILSYVKYINALQDSIGNEQDYSYEGLQKQIDIATKELWPRLSYKTDKIITIREYKVKVNRFDFEEECEEIDVLDNIEIISTKPNANTYKKGDKIFVQDEKKIYVCNEYEETKVEHKEEEAFFLTNAQGIKSSFQISYENSTETLEKENEKITVTKPVIKSMEQIDKDWDGLKAIISKRHKDEDVEKAAEVILASAASYLNDDVKEDMIFTGGGSGGLVTPEEFTGGQSEFVEKVSVGAVESYKKYNVIPSITIAQAILESGWGKSGLTAKANNLFGIKAFGWKGAFVEMLTAEYKGDGSKYYITARFRAYNSWEESIEDHSKVLMQSNFAGVRSATNYRDAAHALRAGGYATDPGYPQLIISTIEMYGLYKYDK